jgi:hypothetical protein
MLAFLAGKISILERKISKTLDFFAKAQNFPSFDIFFYTIFNTYCP